ncbi:DUF3078 domain-containing protein [Alistipes sp. OttesenSCG-928-B03]|nr:DUF3078 domain-containing protein [Alistipes sp. OttesenSCG-928-B03]
MKKIILLFAASFIAFGAAAQQRDTTWTFGGLAGINMSQVSLSNWSAGGEGSIAFDVNFNYNIDYKHDKQLWTNRIELAYGLNNTKTNGTRKTNDKIYLASTYGYKIAPKWYASAFMTFNTQFDEGYDYSVSNENYISKFMAPGYLSAGLGFTWTPKTWFTATFSPATWRGTFVLDDKLSDAGAFGVDPGKKILNEVGANVLAELKLPIMTNIDLYSRLNLYSNYLDNPQNVDVKWDIQVNMKVNRWISASLNLNMIYDDDIKTKRDDGTWGHAKFQFKEVLGIGLQATF